MESNLMTSIDEKLLQKTGFGLMLIDHDDHVTWANEAMSSLLGTPADQWLGSHLDALPETLRQLISAESRPLRLSLADRWVEHELQQDGEGQRLLVLRDVTEAVRLGEENARLHQQIDDLTLTDELTGMPNRRAISQALDLHISRSRRYQNPLSIVLVHVEMPIPADDEPLSSDPVVLAVSRLLRDRLRWVDQIARWDESVFLAVLPETAQSDAQGLLDKIIGEQGSMLLPDAYSDTRPTLSFGLACWKKGDDMRTLLRSALSALKEDSGV